MAAEEIVSCNRDSTIEVIGYERLFPKGADKLLEVCACRSDICEPKRNKRGQVSRFRIWSSVSAFCANVWVSRNHHHRSAVEALVGAHALSDLVVKPLKLILVRKQNNEEFVAP